MRARPAYLATAVSAVSLALPALAWACPQCAGRGDDGLASLLIIGSMILFPFAVSSIVWMVLRRMAEPAASRALPTLSPGAQP